MIARPSEPPSAGTVADAERGHWADTLLPRAVRPYARLARWERPIGWWLLLWPCWWSAALAADAAGRPWPKPLHLALFMIGAIAMRGAGCTWNDLVDRDIDAAVARTRSRPIPSGQVSIRAAWAFLGLQALVGLVVLVQFDRFTIVLCLSSLGIVAIYPFMKRITDWPQAFLGLAFSWGALVGWSAALQRLDVAPVVLYLGCILWTIGYDTIYAHQDKEDDAIVGVRSTARFFAGATRRWLVGLYGAAILCHAGAFALAGVGLLAWIGLAGFALHLAWQVIRLDIDDPDACLALFRANRWAGWILFAGLVADGLRRL
ncbi:4-hydroxybenzoate octaprenyltransferase [Siculibacillus lacustris]|uniref:4-hydroxybenzoate octaprenyltransferase n=1 Tax=Siculibacillus lacustris TaxID=1549641 RepID=A0A4Q9VKE9_9HYPH|nr:4-hydroxybenzoate octaprenyltransferase [Siculibacillus lacustris]TBW34987.1 4-hydroxybenzoate octaprenyltransferase [Siculibacillus lacustris]